MGFKVHQSAMPGLFSCGEPDSIFLQVLWQVPAVVFREVGMGVVKVGDVFLTCCACTFTCTFTCTDTDTDTDS